MSAMRLLYGIIILSSFQVYDSSCASMLTDESAAQESKTVFLTGAAGFIGSNCLEYLFDTYPHYRFLVLDLLTYAGSLRNIPQRIKASDRFEFFYGSVTNRALVDSLMERADYVVHFAAETHVTRSICDDAAFCETDVLGTRVMLSSLVEHANQVSRFIHISTSEVLGTSESEHMDENHPLNPRSPYAAAKAGADRLVYAYWCTYDLPVVMFRPFNMYGPRQHTEKMVPRFISDLLHGRSLTVHGSGLQSRDWTHVRDLCRAVDYALHKGDFSTLKNQVIHVGSGNATSVLDIAKMILKEFNLSEDRMTFVPDRPGQVDRHQSSMEKSYRLLGWRPEIGLQEGLRQTIEWYEENQGLYAEQQLMSTLPIRTSQGVVAQ